jgi:ABC-type multidrug transport system fused ATPase/permease subunit
VAHALLDCSDGGISQWRLLLGCANLPTISVFCMGLNMLHVQVGDLASFAMYSSLVGLGFSGLSSFAADLSKGLASAERVFELLDQEPDVPLDEGATPPLDSVRGELVLEEVTFRYPTRDKVCARQLVCGRSSRACSS